MGDRGGERLKTKGYRLEGLRIRIKIKMKERLGVEHGR